LFPRSTLMLAALSVAALGNLGLQAFHLHDASIMVLTWHLGGVALLSALGGLLGPDARLAQSAIRRGRSHEDVGRATVTKLQATTKRMGRQQLLRRRCTRSTR